MKGVREKDLKAGTPACVKQSFWWNKKNTEMRNRFYPLFYENNREERDLTAS